MVVHGKIPSDDEPLTAAYSDGTGKWGWSWRAPWGALHTSELRYKTEETALAAGRRWVSEQS